MSSEVKSLTRNPLYDAIKGFAILFVVVGHVYRVQNASLDIIIRALSWWTVPAFFIIQGYFMRSASFFKNKRQNIINKIQKAYVPFLLWAIVYGAFRLLAYNKPFNILDVFFGRTAEHLYFMPLYMLFAITMPFLYYLNDKLRRAILWLMVISNFALIGLIEAAHRMHFSIYGLGSLPFKWWGFIAIGMLAAEMPDVVTYFRKHLLLSYIIGFSVLILSFVWLNLTGINSKGYILDNAAYIPMSLGIYLLVTLFFCTDKSWIRNAFVYLGHQTFSIYLPHVLLLRLLTMAFVAYNWSSYLVLRPIIIAGLIVASIALTEAIARIIAIMEKLTTVNP